MIAAVLWPLKAWCIVIRAGGYPQWSFVQSQKLIWLLTVYWYMVLGKYTDPDSWTLISNKGGYQIKTSEYPIFTFSEWICNTEQVVIDRHIWDLVMFDHMICNYRGNPTFLLAGEDSVLVFISVHSEQRYVARAIRCAFQGASVNASSCRVLECSQFTGGCASACVCVCVDE